MYMQARYYDPEIGRFYSNDPVDYIAENPVMSFNRYLYVNNNPYKYNDPNGEVLFNIIGGIIGAVTTYNQAIDMGYTHDEAMVAGGVGGLVGFVTGGLSGGATSLGIKAAAKVAVKQSNSKVAAQLAGSSASGGATGFVTQYMADAAGDVARGQAINVDMGKVYGKSAEGAFTGFPGGTPPALLGANALTNAAGIGIATQIEGMKISNEISWFN